MPAPKAKNPSTNGAGAKGSKQAKATKESDALPTPSATTSGKTSPIPPEDGKQATAHRGRPDKAAYDAEQDSVKKEIEALQVKMSAIQEKISSFSTGTGSERRNELRSQWENIRSDQSKIKSSRSKVVEQLKALNENISKKIKDLQAAKTRISFKTVAEVDAQIKRLEQQVESGTLKLADEKRALQEISQHRRSRRTVETFQAEQESIDRDRAAADELRKQLDDPESQAITERADSIKAKLDALRKEEDETYANRNKLFEERNALKAQLDELYKQKRESVAKYKAANDAYWEKVREDQARRAERAKAQRQADDEAKKKEVALRLREEAEIPAYQEQVEDCQTLIEYFIKLAGGVVPAAPSLSSEKSELNGVPKLEIRQVETAPAEGVVVRKKKGEDEDAYFIGGKGKAKGKKGGARTAGANETSNGSLHVPLPTLRALLSLSIPPPTSPADLPQTIENLKTKKSWFEANQARVTAENIAKAEENIKKLLNGTSSTSADAAADDVPPNGNGEKPAEPAPTPATPDDLSKGVQSQLVDEKLESIKEVQKEVEAEA